MSARRPPPMTDGPAGANHGCSVEELAEMEKAAASTPPAPPDNDADDIMRTMSGKVIHMHSEVWGHWSQTDYTAIKVRGADYLVDQVKIPPPCPPMMEIAHLEIYQVQGQIFHVCSKKGNWLQQYKAKQKQKAQGGGSSSSSAAAAPSTKGKHHHHKGRGGSAGSSPALAPAAAPATAPAPAPAPASAASSFVGGYASYFGWGGSSASVPPPMPALPDLSSGAGLRPFDPDFFFVVNFHVQTAPTFHLTMYFRRRDAAHAGAEEEEHEPRAAAAARKSFDTLFERFVRGDTAFRNSRLKLLPFVVDGGSWMVNKAVGNRPAIIGKAMSTTYHCNAQQNYLEVDIDVSGSRIGSGIFRVVKGYAAYLTLDLTLLIEGQEDDELPEVVLGGCRLRRLDLSKPEMREIPPPITA